MGPGEISRSAVVTVSKLAKLEPPTFVAKTDSYDWMKAVADWPDLVQAVSYNGTDKFIKTHNATVLCYLHISLPKEQRLVIDRAMSSVNIGFKNDGPAQVVRDIV